MLTQWKQTEGYISWRRNEWSIYCLAEFRWMTIHLQLLCFAFVNFSYGLQMHWCNAMNTLLPAPVYTHISLSLSFAKFFWWMWEFGLCNIWMQRWWDPCWLLCQGGWCQINICSTLHLPYWNIYCTPFLSADIPTMDDAYVNAIFRGPRKRYWSKWSQRLLVRCGLRREKKNPKFRFLDTQRK